MLDRHCTGGTDPGRVDELVENGIGPLTWANRVCSLNHHHRHCTPRLESTDVHPSEQRPGSSDDVVTCAANCLRLIDRVNKEEVFQRLRGGRTSSVVSLKQLPGCRNLAQNSRIRGRRTEDGIDGGKLNENCNNQHGCITPNPAAILLPIPASIPTIKRYRTADVPPAVVLLAQRFPVLATEVC